MKAHILVCFLALIVKWHICKTLNQYSQSEGRNFLQEMINLKAIVVDPSLKLCVRTSLSIKVEDQLNRLKMKVPGKVLSKSQPTAVPQPKRVLPASEHQLRLPEVTDTV